MASMHTASPARGDRGKPRPKKGGRTEEKKRKVMRKTEIEKQGGREIKIQEKESLHQRCYKGSHLNLGVLVHRCSQVVKIQ